MRHRLLPAAGVFASLCIAGTPVFGQDITVGTNVSGITIAGTKPSWTTGFGAVNGMGLGTPGTNQTILTPGGGGGVLYTSPYNIVVTGVSGTHKAVVRAAVTTNFVHTLVLQVYACSSSCTNAGNYAALSTNVGAPTDIIPSPGSNNATVVRYLGIFVGNQNGASAFTGTDFATLSILVYDDSNNSLKKTYTLALTNPIQNVQTALRFTLATAPGGRTISPGSDFSIGFGNVNGLGIGPGSGLSATAASGSALYSTPYLLQATFAGFSTTTGTIKTYVSTDFVHPSQLELRDSSTGSSFVAISKTAGAQTTLTSAMTSGSSVTRYLGLFVSGANGASIFTGTDNATVTFTLVVP
jgi:hypothetical protein